MTRRAGARTSGSSIASIALLFVLCFALQSCALFGESPEPEDVDLVFEGLGPVDREEAVSRIAYVFEDFARVTRAEPVLDDAAYELELLFNERGFREARVQATLERFEDKQPSAKFEVRAGVRTRLARLTTPGVPDRDRRDVASILSGVEVLDWYSERAVSVGSRAVLEWYRDRGHIDVVVSEARVEFSDDGSEAVVEIPVVPGAAYRLARVDVEAEAEGQAVAWPAEVPRSAIEESLRDLLRAPYSDRVMRTARGRIANMFAENAHPDAKAVLASRELGTGEVVLAFRVDPGPRVRVGSVLFRGQVATNEKFLEKRVVLEEGAFYQRSLLRASLANLSRAGLFDRVSVDLAPATERADRDGTVTRDVVVEVEEAAAREFYIEPGYGSYEGLRLGIGARQKNLFGTGRILDFSVTAAELAQRADLSLIDPWLLGPEATAIATVFWNRRQEPSFLRLEQGLKLGASWRLSEEWGVRGTWEYRETNTSDVEVDAPEFIDDVNVSEVSLEPTWDTRDAYDDPHRGQLSRAGLDLSLDVFGSQIEYVRLKLEHAHFVPLGSRTTLALSARAGWIAPIGATEEIPIQERFFNGGENSVRSFSESKLGPKDSNGNPIGGEATTTATVELRQSIGRRFQVAAFVDAGTVELQHQDVFRFTDPGFALGLGLRYLLPIGPIRLDGALNPDPGEGEADSAVHLSVGFSF